MFEMEVYKQERFICQFKSVSGEIVLKKELD